MAVTLAIHGYVYWADVRIRQMVARNGGQIFRFRTFPDTWERSTFGILLKPYTPIADVSLSPTTPTNRSDIAVLRQATSLVSIAIHRPMTPEAISEIGNFRHLTAIQLSYDGSGPSDADLLAMTQSRKLRQIFFDSTQFDTRGLRHLSTLPDFVSLHIANIPAGDSDIETVEFSTEAFARLAESPSLQQVIIRNSPGFRDEHLLALTGSLDDGREPLPKLGLLNLSVTNVTGRGLKYIGNLSQLESLTLSSNPVGSEGLQALKWNPTLHTLNLRNTAVDDDCIETLNSMPRLVWLDIAGTQISEQGLLKLAQNDRLKQLYVSATVSHETLMKLRDRLACYPVKAYALQTSPP
jgi:hypothetical protein